MNTNVLWQHPQTTTYKRTYNIQFYYYRDGTRRSSSGRRMTSGPPRAATVRDHRLLAAVPTWERRTSPPNLSLSRQAGTVDGHSAPLYGVCLCLVWLSFKSRTEACVASYPVQQREAWPLRRWIVWRRNFGPSKSGQDSGNPRGVVRCGYSMCSGLGSSL